MKCWKCKNEAIGICRFCGRGLCSEHYEEKVFIISAFIDPDDNLNCLPVGKALYCGKCKPAPKPVIISGPGFPKKNNKKK